MDHWTLVEPCSGSAAFTLHLLGASRALLPYQGSKWRFRHSLTARAAKLGFQGRPKRVVLSDPGPWGHTLKVVVEPTRRRRLIDALKALAAEDPRDVYNRLHGGFVSPDDVEAAAEHLFLQRLSFSGKAVGQRDGRWVSPGFNTSSAYGLAGTERFGAVKPMVPSLIRVLQGYECQIDASVSVVVHPHEARPPTERVANTLVYLDPPYEGSTAYPNGSLQMTEVCTLAEAWRRSGAAVMVSEQRGVPLASWSRERLYAGRDDTSPFRGKQEEWVTWTAPSLP